MLLLNCKLLHCLVFLKETSAARLSCEVVKRLCKQCMNCQETAHILLCDRGFQNCLNVSVVKLFIERLQTTSVTQNFNFLSF